MDKLPVDRTAAERLRLGTDELVVLATATETNGALFAVDVRMPPGGGPPLMHRHAPGEIYYVREGEFTFYLGHPSETVRRVTAGPGDVMPLIGGTPHTVRNESDADAVAFVVHAPGAPMEQFTRAAEAMAAEAGEVDVAAVLRLADQHGIEMLGPVPTAVG